MFKVVISNISCFTQRRLPVICSAANLSLSSKNFEDCSAKSINTQKIYLSNPKGTRYFSPSENKLRKEIIKKVEDTFEKYGAVSIETPLTIFKELVDCNNGMDQKQIFEIKTTNKREDQALRYDLTVPLSIYIATKEISKMKVYQIGPVFRKDDPLMHKGRLRQFIQCDYDIVGKYDDMIADAECLALLGEVLSKLDVGKYHIKINDRRILDGILLSAGCSKNQLQSICSIIDRMDKIKWSGVEKLLLGIGVHETTVNKIKHFMFLQGNDLLEELRATLKENESALKGIQDIKTLLLYLKALNVHTKVSIDLSLARGMTYYTGLIFEAVLVNDWLQVGSIAGGGRYDHMIGRFSEKNTQVPCVGFSVGIERIFVLLQSKLKIENTNSTKVFICSPKPGVLLEKLELLQNLRDNEIPAAISYKDRTTFYKQMQECEKKRIPIAVMLGKQEIEQGVVKIRNVETRKETFVKRGNLIQELKNVLN